MSFVSWAVPQVMRSLVLPRVQVIPGQEIIPPDDDFKFDTLFNFY